MYLSIKYETWQVPTQSLAIITQFFITVKLFRKSGNYGFHFVGAI